MSNISWFIPKLIEGSGGHRTMLQHAEFLESKGHNCTIYLEDKSGKSDGSDLIFGLFQIRLKKVFYGWDKFQPCDVAIATIWYSAPFVASLPFNCKKIYFVQDYEAYFNPVGDSYLMAENSYSYGLTPITIGRWLRHKLKSDFSISALHFEFGVNHKIYKRINSISKQKAICFIYQPDKPRRCSRIGIEALGIVKHIIPDVKIYLYGSTIKENLWFEHENLGLLSLNSCNELYNKCTVGLCISSSNPSRVPFEMMQSGLPVVEIWRENNLYDFDDNAMLLCKQTPESIAEGIIKILNNDLLAKCMGESGEKFMTGRTLENENEEFYDAFLSATNNTNLVDSELVRSYTKPPFQTEKNRPDIATDFYYQKNSFLRRIFSKLPFPIKNKIKTFIKQ
ncbi:glycosyl transferase family 1 [Rosenbergiella australiborealis]|uniref:rhamnosyltransferase WsaF family glycosyltransferase n=1 Tax=Rosenbergiella australiborealis TaxID=1544696 RepID=UPI001F4E5632|nr:glycosyl transferase family 1 [Rosenbergiella australiborealis]